MWIEAGERGSQGWVELGFNSKKLSAQGQIVLELLRESLDVYKERCLGAETYLQICAYNIDNFCSPTIDLRAKLVLASKVSFFFWLWRLWLNFGYHSFLETQLK